MSQVPENRTQNNTVVEHAADHNEFARLHNKFDNEQTASGMHVGSLGDSTLNSVNVGWGNTTLYDGGGDPLQTYNIAVGTSNTSHGWMGIAFGTFNTAKVLFSVAAGWMNAATGVIGTAIGQGNVTPNYIGVAMGYQNSASGSEAVAIGNRVIAGGNHSLAVGGTQDGGYTRAYGDYSAAIGTNNKIHGNRSVGVGNVNIVGYPERVFTCAAAGTTLTIAGGDYTAEYANGDTVLITQAQDYSNMTSVQKVISNVTYNSGPNTTTFTIPTAIPDSLALGYPPTTLVITTGRVIDMNKAQRSGAFGYNNVVTASDAYVLGQGITNSIAGSVQIGSTGGIILKGNIPTSDPAVAGQIWNSSGTLMISAG
jgi:hypothetical protein